MSRWMFIACAFLFALSVGLAVSCGDDDDDDDDDEQHVDQECLDQCEEDYPPEWSDRYQHDVYPCEWYFCSCECNGDDACSSGQNCRD